MSKKLTKLSRARPKIDSTNKQLNNSDEDFQSVIVKPSTTQKISQTHDESSAPKNKIVESNNSTVFETSAPLQPCPFCSKKFNNVQELTRLSHLKACATQLGIDTNQLLEIRKLEDRQAEEWKALNLPKISNVSKNSTTRSNNASLKLKRAEFQATNDPNLEIALALSASMAGTTVDDSNALKSEKVEEINDESGKQCWLPQVHWTNLPGIGH